MAALIRFFIMTFLFYVLFKFLFSPLFKALVKALIAETAGQKRYRENNEIHFKSNYTSPKSRGRSTDEGEYIDYEELK